MPESLLDCPLTIKGSEFYSLLEAIRAEIIHNLPESSRDGAEHVLKSLSDSFLNKIGVETDALRRQLNGLDFRNRNANTDWQRGVRLTTDGIAGSIKFNINEPDLLTSGGGEIVDGVFRELLNKY